MKADDKIRFVLNKMGNDFPEDKYFDDFLSKFKENQNFEKESSFSLFSFKKLRVADFLKRFYRIIDISKFTSLSSSLGVAIFLAVFCVFLFFNSSDDFRDNFVLNKILKSNSANIQFAQFSTDNHGFNIKDYDSLKNKELITDLDNSDHLISINEMVGNDLSRLRYRSF